MSIVQSSPLTMTNVEVKVEVDPIHDNGNPVRMNLQKNFGETIDIEEFGIQTFKKEFPPDANPEQSIGETVATDSSGPCGNITSKISLDDCVPSMTIPKSEPLTIDSSFEYFDHSSVIRKNLNAELEDECNGDPLDDNSPDIDTDTAIPVPVRKVGKPSKGRRQKTHTGQNTIVCRCCEETFAIKSEYESHFRLHAGEKPYKCETCDKTFSNPVNLKDHKFTHTGEKPYKCKTCDKVLSSYRSLWIHNKNHTGDKPHRCDSCGKSFTQISKLITHKRIHTKEKPFGCETCGLSFSLKHYLTEHKMYHTGERPHNCKICGMSFAKSSGLVLHMGMVHLTEKPYKCEKCSKSFARLGNLKLHYKTHKGDTLFQCDQCGKSFPTLILLTVHKISHPGKCKCEICGNIFSSPDAFKKHKLCHTGEKSELNTIDKCNRV